jgi:hypothetical protein
MKSLNTYIKEGLSDWSDDKLGKRMDELTSEEVIKKEIIGWIINSAVSINENKLKFDFSTTPITVDYDGDIRFKIHITSLTNGIFQWGKIGGYFDCSQCESLKTLEGAPKIVGRFFNCSYCKLLKSLGGAPKEVGWDFYCKSCPLDSLEGAPEKVCRSFFCNNCSSLKTLEGTPKEVGGSFECSNCSSLKTLEGAPKIVGRFFNCSRCYNLESLKGAPKKVGWYFDCTNCGTKFTEKDVKKVSKVKGDINC